MSYKSNEVDDEQSKDHEDTDSSGEECVICTYKIKDEQPYSKIKEDNHKYHIECIDDWLRTNNRSIFSYNFIDNYIIMQNNQVIEEVSVPIKNDDEIETNRLIETYNTDDTIQYYNSCTFCKPLFLTLFSTSLFIFLLFVLPVFIINN